MYLMSEPKFRPNFYGSIGPCFALLFHELDAQSSTWSTDSLPPTSNTESELFGLLEFHNTQTM